VVADDRKQVSTLGAFPLPIEVTPFSHNTTRRAIAEVLGCEVVMRSSGGALLTTDNGNYIADAQTGATITNPVETEAALLALAGVVQVGLFNNMCDVVVMASGDGITVLTKQD
jgi:ribose 5-phosphate isomerase A